MNTQPKDLAQQIIDDFLLKIPVKVTYGPHWLDMFHEPDQSRIGHLNYKLTKDHLSQLTILVKDEFKKQGVSRALLAYCIVENPQIKSIDVELTGTNEEVFQSAIDSGKTPLEAFRETPAYRIRSTLGFNEVKIIDDQTHQFLCYR